ncbi:MAG: P-II family nitrogen regulator [Firmicutes bacterium]|nr:P-II family nitrogen regulator [Bacillota bacterium]
MEFNAIFVIVQRGKADKLVEAAKAAGAKGATVFYARGTGIHEAHKFFGLTMDAAKEVVVILSEADKTKEITAGLVEAGNLKCPGTGIAFVLPVLSLIGLAHREEMEQFLGGEN